MTCPRCGADGPLDFHHVVGRAVGATCAPLCGPCHHHVHNRLRGLGYDQPDGCLAELGPAGPVELGLRRLVVLLGELHYPGWLPEAASGLADRLVLDIDGRAGERTSAP